MDNSIKIIERSEGELLGIAGGNYRIIIPGAETGGNYAVIEMLVPPGGGPPLHAHVGIQEMFHVVEGEVEFQTELGRKLVAAGGFVNIPFGGALHCFQNKSGKFARLMCTVVPAGLDDLFREIGTHVSPGQFLPAPEFTPERAALVRMLDEKYGIKTYPRDYLG